MDTTAAPLKLHALGGAAAPPDLRDDLRRLSRMPPEALARLWQALGPCLAEQISKETEQLLDVFCSAYRLESDDFARAIKACRFLIQGAVKRDVPAEALAADLELLCPDAPVIKEVLCAGYEPVRAHLRKEMAVAALVGHGKLLVGADWRVDTITASGHGTKLGLPVAMLTLHYREGDRTRRITLQVLPDMMGQLRGICEEVLP